MEIKQIRHKHLLLFISFLIAFSNSSYAQDVVNYKVRKINSEMVIDGKLDEQVWSDAEPTSNFAILGDKQTTPKTDTWAKMLWDDKYLYVAFYCEDKNLVAEYQDRDDPLYKEDVVEVYIDPDGDGENYLEVELSPANIIFDLWLTKPRKHGGQGFTDWTMEELKTQSTYKGSLNSNSDEDESWICEMALPFEAMKFSATSMNFPPQEKEAWRFNLYRFDRAYNDDKNGEATGWSQTEGGQHEPDNFGEIIFEGLSVDTNQTTNIHTNSEFPLRGIFYYAWYPNTWKPNGFHVQYNPTLGYYTSTDVDAINHHITELEYSHIDVAIASWWGLDNDNRIPRDTAIDRCMRETDRRTTNGEIDLKWAIYYELEAFYNEPMDTVKADLEYLMERYVKRHSCYAHIDGKPILFVYTRGSEDNTEEFMKKWVDAVDNKWYYVLKVFGGYKDIKYQPSSWHQYGPSTRIHKMEDSSRKMISYNISPGFKHADPNKDTFLERATQQEWTDLIKEMVDSKVDWQLVTSYNEWGEGTAIESAAEWQTDSGYGMYLDALHNFPTKDDLATSIEDFNEGKSVNIYPNPLKGNLLTVDLSGFKTIEPIYITITSLMGQTVYSYTAQNNEYIEIETSGLLKKGIYLVTVKSGKSFKTAKLVSE